MKRFFIVHDDDLPTKTGRNAGYWHSIDLGSHDAAAQDWHVVVLHDSHVIPPDAWAALPSVLDSRRPAKEVTPLHVHLRAVGLTGDETTLEVATHLAKILPPFWS